MKSIIELAKQAHRELVTIDCPGHIALLDPWTQRLCERFAALVRAQALEEAAGMCETNADRWPGTSKVYAAMECAAAIRARAASTTQPPAPPTNNP